MSNTAEILKPFGEYLALGADEGVIEVVEDLLAKARAGEIVAVAVAAIAPNGFCLTRANRGTRGMGELVGGVAALQQEIIEQWRSE